MHLPQPEIMKTILAGRIFDPYTLEFLEQRVITVSEDSGLILDVRPFSDDEYPDDLNDSDIVDLRNSTVLPGFVDAHVHFFLHPYSEVSWEDQLTKESLAERTVRATVHAKRTLMAGYTAVRDLGTEGAGDADIALRKCLSGRNPLIPGPRYFCANRAIVPTGSYGPKSSLYVNQEGIDGVTGAEVADGVEECRKAVRRQIGAGADWIKIYADYRFRSRASQVSAEAGRASMNTFSLEELQVMAATASLYGVKIAAHATNRETIYRLRGLVHTVEHGYDVLGRYDGEDDLEEIYKEAFDGTALIWVPTLSAYYTMGQGAGETWAKVAKAFQIAIKLGADNIACGGDTGVFSHGDNALEMKLMVRLGAPWRKVLRWGTLGGWKCIRSKAWEGKAGEKRLGRVGELREDERLVGDNEVPFGAIRRGFAADIIATSGDLDRDFEGAISASSITFVMKGGRVYKEKGVEVVSL